MNTLAIELPPETYQRLQEQARRMGKPPESLIKDLVEKALREEKMEEKVGESTRQILEASGRVHPLSDALRRRIIYGVTLEEVRNALSRTSSPSLGEIVLEQRGLKS